MVIAFTLVGCKDQKESPSIPSYKAEEIGNNLLAEISANNPNSFQWLNQPETFTIQNGTLTILASKGTDFFNNPEDSSITATAPIFFRELTGDFMATALVKPDFSSQWNAVALMVYMDDDYWIKYAFENSDATGKSIVSVVTKGVSDDANGVILNDRDQIWLKMIRKGDLFAMFWSMDGDSYKMTRLTRMPETEKVKIGIEAQSPVGEPVTHEIKFFGIEQKTVEDMRKGE